MPETVTRNLPVLALRGVTAFPGQTVSFDVEREISIYALDNAMESDRRIFAITQKELSTSEPGERDLYAVGTVCHILQIVKTSDTTVRVVVEGESRARLLRLWQTQPFLQGQAELLPEQPARSTARTEALLRRTYVLFDDYRQLASGLSDDFTAAVLDCRDAGELADLIAQNITLRHQDRQRVLEELHPEKRLRLVNDILTHEVDVLSLESEMEQKVRRRVAQVQRDMILREQVKVLQHELGEDGDEELEAYAAKIDALRLPEEVHNKLLRELERLGKQPYSSAESAVIRNYLDVCLELPWNKTTRDRADVAQARKILDKDHYGLDKVKERILEFIAVRQLNPDAKGKILCLVGPPGVGKTSIARSIAAALGRKYVRVSLGGVRDEADIRGHRKTYIGAMPGRIMNAVRLAGVKNPVILLDEIDKMSHDFRGDPTSAMLEVLDTEQNSAFRDHYIEMPFDLSHVFFIATANDRSAIPPALLDRMEVIELPSYTREEKFQIAKRHLLPKQRERHGLSVGQIAVTDGAIYDIIDHYTREAGVRTLERRLAALCRKVAAKVVSGEATEKVTIKAADLPDYLGPRYITEDIVPKEDSIGLVNGLAWTAVGGELLQVETAVVPGTGKTITTGSLGNVMKESVTAAITYIRSVAEHYEIENTFYKDKDIHIHFPEGAVPKDGPSAGITTCTALISALGNIPVRHDVAMTGEITLRGRVLAIGGLREKSMAAYKNGIKTVIIPAANEPDLAEIDDVVKKAIHFVPVHTMEEVLEQALVQLPGGAQKRGYHAAATEHKEASSAVLCR